MIDIDSLCYDSKLRFINPMEKIIYTVMTIFLLIFSRSIIVAIVVLVVNHVLNTTVGGLTLRRYIKLMSIPIAFIILSTIAIIVNFSRVKLNLYAIPLGSFYITGSKEGVIRGIQLILTAFSSVSSLYFLSLNTTMVDIIYALRTMKLPKIFVELMMLIYRYIFLLLELAINITIAQKSRLGYKNYATSLKSFASMLSSVFIKSIRMSSQLYDALDSRGYDGELRVVNEFDEFSKKRFICIFIFGIILVFLMRIR